METYILFQILSAFFTVATIVLISYFIFREKEDKEDENKTN